MERLGMRLAVAVALALLSASACFAGGSSAASMSVWTATDMAKVMRNATAEHLQRATLFGARNEYVSFQIVLTASSGSLDGVDSTASPLRGPHGIIPASAYHLYRETYQDVTHASDAAGHSGYWPDGLIPIGRDPIVGELRNGAPYTVAGGDSQTMWVDLHIPASQKPGTYTGTIGISASNSSSAVVPVRLNVWNFGIPSQPSLATSFGFDTWDAYQGHYGTNWDTDKIVNMTNRYSEAALQMRISMNGIDVAGPDYTYDSARSKLSPIDWSLWDRTEGPANNGRLDGTGRHFMAAALPLPVNLSDLTHNHNAEDVAFWRATAAYYRQHHWLDKSYFYYDDEPSSASDFSLARLHAQLLHQGSPALKYILTTHYRPDLAGKVDIWVPIINELDSPGYPRPSVYRTRQRAGDRVWWYDSDSSADNGQWPDMFIDHPSMNQRVMGWMTWKYALNGFLYYSTVEAYSSTNNPWSNVYFFGTNGDGTLFYPGKPSIIGGKTDIPCFSIRLMLIRQSLQDYEYMRLLKAAGHAAIANTAVNAVVKSSDSFSHDPSVLLKERMMMGRALSKLGG